MDPRDKLLLMKSPQHHHFWQKPCKNVEMLGTELSFNDQNDNKACKKASNPHIEYSQIKWWRLGELSVIFMVFHPRPPFNVVVPEFFGYPE